jgi:hypothetical protein
MISVGGCLPDMPDIPGAPGVVPGDEQLLALPAPGKRPIAQRTRDAGYMAYVAWGRRGDRGMRVSEICSAAAVV